MRHRPTPPPPRPGALRRLHTRLARLPAGRGRQLLVPLLAMGVLTVGGTAAASITGLPSSVIDGVPGGTGTPAEVTALADASAGAVAGRAERPTRAAPSATPSESVVPAAPAPVATSGPASATTGEVTPPEARSTVTGTVTATDTATAAAAAEDVGATEDDSTDEATDEGTAPAAEVTAAGSAAAGPETETPAAGPETPAAGSGSPATGSPQPATTSPRPAPAATATPGPEGEVLTLVNRARAAAGCPALRADPGLAGVARAHSADMRDRQYFAHVDPDGRDPFDRARAAGLTNARAENIASGQPDAEAVMASWMKSPPHRENILDCSLTTLGVGVAQGAGGPWWTQLFGG